MGRENFFSREGIGRHVFPVTNIPAKPLQRGGGKHPDNVLGAGLHQNGLR